MVSSRSWGPLLVVAGVALAAAGLWLHAQNPSLVARVPLTGDGTTAQADFEVPRASRYEVELEFEWEALPYDFVEEVVRSYELQPQLAVRWSVESAGQGLGAGDCADFIAIPRWTGRVQRWIDRVFLREDHRWPDAEGLRRVVGSFRADPTQPLRIDVDVESLPAAAWDGAPTVNVRLNAAERYGSRGTPDRVLFAGGLLFALGAVVSFVTGLRRRA